MVLQLLPVKQAVRYFFIDNFMAEEMQHISKDATKNFRLLDEDNSFADFDYSLHHYKLLNNLISYHFAEVLPAIQAADIHTPPPNNYFI